MTNAHSKRYRLCCTRAS